MLGAVGRWGEARVVRVPDSEGGWRLVGRGDHTLRR